MYGLHSPSRCWLLFFKSYFMKFHIFILSLPKQAVSCHSPCRCFISSLSKQVVNSHSQNRCWLFQFFLFLMQFQIFYTNTLQAGLRFMFSMQMFGLHSPSRCWLFLNSSMFHRISYFSYSQSPCRCLVNTLSLDIDQCSKLRVRPAPGAHISVDGRTFF